MPNTREKLIELLADVGLCHYTTIADHLIANGVTIPVRCGACKRCYKDKSRNQYFCDVVDGAVTEDGFCSYGERRNDEA